MQHINTLEILQPTLVIMEIKHILHKCPSKRSFRHRIHSMLKRPDAGGSADIIYRI